MDESLLNQIQTKANEMDKAIEGHHEAIRRLEADREELTATLVTLRKHNLLPPPVPRVRHRVAITEALVVGAKAGATKMTAPEMILTALDRFFPDGSEPNAVLEKIKERFDPNVDPNNIRPTMWRMAKDGRLAKIGDKYCLPQTNEAADTPSKDASTASALERHAAEGGVPVLY